MILWELVNFMLGALVVRHLFVLGAVLRSRRFLRYKQQPALTSEQAGPPPIFYVVIPVLREATGLRQAIAHFEALAEGHVAKVIIVTTAREAAEAHRYSDAPDTVPVADKLVGSGKSVHVHYPDPTGLKGDQINFAADHCATSLQGEAALRRAFVVVYDADSRPPLDSLRHFEQAIAQHPEVSVFHQSSRFELRTHASGNLLARLRHAIADSGALRANRFVLGYELPRLINRSNSASVWRRRLSSCVYTHVTGHGLCVRLSLLWELPFPTRSPLEDMHYSFLLGSRDLPMVPLASLDCAEVPASLSIQFQQLARWFYGPARFLQYLADPNTQPGWRSRLLGTSAAGITIEWLSCAIMLPLLTVLLWFGDVVTRGLIGVFVAIYVAQLVVVDSLIGSAEGPSDSTLRLLMYPVTFTMFGIAGLVGLGRLNRGGFSMTKTERS